MVVVLTVMYSRETLLQQQRDAAQTTHDKLQAEVTRLKNLVKALKQQLDEDVCSTLYTYIVVSTFAHVSSDLCVFALTQYLSLFLSI